MFLTLQITGEAIVAEQNEIQPHANKDIDITSVAYEKVDQPGAKSFLKQMQGLSAHAALVMQCCCAQQFPALYSSTSYCTVNLR